MVADLLDPNGVGAVGDAANLAGDAASIAANAAVGVVFMEVENKPFTTKTGLKTEFVGSFSRPSFGSSSLSTSSSRPSFSGLRAKLGSKLSGSSVSSLPSFAKKEKESFANTYYPEKFMPKNS